MLHQHKQAPMDRCRHLAHFAQILHFWVPMPKFRAVAECESMAARLRFRDIPV
jgi:hypothetical protein